MARDDPSPPPVPPTTLPTVPTVPTRRGRRWLRVLAPPLVALVAILATLVVHAIEQPRTSNPGYLNPAGTGDSGSATLAQRLRAGGTSVRTATGSLDALDLAGTGDATLFVPAADYIRADQRARLADLPASVTVVLVRPSLTILDWVGLSFLDKQTRWATRAAQGCTGPAPNPTGPALVYRDHFQLLAGVKLPSTLTVTRDCFGHAVQGWRSPGRAELVLVGADDIFRNDRIGELGNAELAAALLAGHPRLIWLNLHKLEQPPKQPHSQHDGQDDDQPPPEPDSDAGLPVPGWVKAAAAGLAVAAVLAALAAGRRLGPPVEEPLPVRPRATETALGRGRLYRRARARQTALDALRSAAIHRLRSTLRVPPDAPDAELVTAVSERTGSPGQYVHAVLHGPEPADDEQLTAAVAALDAMVEQAMPTPLSQPSTDYDPFVKEGP